MSGSACMLMASFGDFTHCASGTSQTGHEKSAVGLTLNGSTDPSTSFLVVAPLGVTNIGEKPMSRSPAAPSASLYVRPLAPAHHSEKAPPGRRKLFLPASFSSACALPTSSW